VGLVRLKILIAPDKFKGTLTAREAAQAIARGWRKARSQDELDLLPMSDGGDGFGEVLGEILHAGTFKTKTVDAAHRRCIARWWWESKTKTAIIESANVIGLAMLPPGKFHPFELDTFGLGAVIQAAAKKGAKHCVLGIGGSATNDGGFGLARALGWKFFTRDKIEISHWTDLHALAEIRAPKRTQWFDELIVAVDVQNPLLGARGATRVYGPQKGLRAEEFQIAEKNLRRLARAVEKYCCKNFAKIPGAGAAGGLGFGLLAFAGARLEPGFDLFARFAKLEPRVRAADLLITGEGRLDESTLMGKGVGRLAGLCREFKTPCVALAGTISESFRSRDFTQMRVLTDLTTTNEAKSQPTKWLAVLAEKVARDFEAAS
jgi:glycerate kinase